MKKLYCHNGDFSEIAPSISLENRSLFFGDGIYDALLGKGCRLFWGGEHIDRFLGNTAPLELSCPYVKETLTDLLCKGGEIFGDRLYFLYFSLMRKSADRTHVFDRADPSDFLAIYKEIASPSTDCRPSLVTVPDRRYSYCNVKTLNLLPNVLAATEAKKKGVDEAVFMRDGHITEGTHFNLSLLFGNTLVTHPDGERILPGITKAKLIQNGKDLGFAVEQTPFSPADTYLADGVILTSTSKLAVLCKSLDGIPFKEPSENAKLLCHSLFREFSAFIS